jgi:uncharacterized protein (DUF58 family)
MDDARPEARPATRPRGRRVTLRAQRAVAVLGAGVGLGLVALIFDAGPLLVPAVALVLLGAVAPAWILLAGLGLRLRREVPEERVVEQAPLTTVVDVRGGWLGAPGAELRGAQGARPVSLSGALSPTPVLVRERACLSVVVRYERRGWHRLGAATVILRDPLDLTRASLAVPGGERRVLVLPRTEPVGWAAPDLLRRLSTQDGGAGSDALAAVDLDGLRPYRPGTPASRIYWPAVARGAGLFERRLRAEGETRPLVVLDTRVAGPGSEADADAAVRAAASLTLALARAGGCDLLLPGERRPVSVDSGGRAWAPIHRRLALVEAGPTARAPGAAGLAGRVGPLLYVAAAPGERAAALRRRPGSGPALLVVPESALRADGPPGLSGAARVLTVSGCAGFAVSGRALLRASRPAPAGTGRR